MKDLNLPVMKKILPEAKRLSMDDYLKFVYLHLKYTYNRRAYKKWKKMLMVNVPFFIKE